jgi:hypothetical protein
MQLFSAQDFDGKVTWCFQEVEVSGEPYAEIANKKVKPVFQEMNRLRHDQIALKKKYAELDAQYQKLWKAYYSLKAKEK